MSIIASTLLFIGSLFAALDGADQDRAYHAALYGALAGIGLVLLVLAAKP